METMTPPAPRVVVRRLTDEHRAIKPGEHILLDDATARCLRHHGIYKGWKMVQRTEKDGVRIWRLS